jgi:integrase
MARTLKDTALDSRTARARLKPSGKPYYRTIEEGLHLGYRKPRGRKGKPAVSGKWVWRRHIEDHVSKTGKKQPYVVETIGIADDFTDADGAAILNFSQAQNAARALFQRNAQAKAGIGPYTVAAAMGDYVQRLAHEGKDTRDSQWRIDAHIIPRLGAIECSKLTAKKIREWHAEMASVAGRLRPERKTGKQQSRKFDKRDAEDVRKRKVSANRVFAILRAGLNQAFVEGRIISNREWLRVKPFKGVNVSRPHFLSVEEAQRLINACDPEFRPMIEAALTTGCRYGELCRLEVKDFDRHTKTLTIYKSKSGKVRKVYLGDEGVQLFVGLTAGRPGGERIIKTDDGLPFGKSYQIRPMREACARAKISPAIGFHQLRHSFASLLVKSGIPMLYVADALGHASTAMTERYYAHAKESAVSKAIRDNVPVFGFKKSNLVGMR